MITIPTGDLTGVLGDVYHFACPLKDLPEINAVRIEWDGKQLHTMATDRHHVGWSTWDPDDKPEDQPDQEELFNIWGGDEPKFATVISRDDAKHVVDAFKLGAKLYYTPLTLTFTHNGELKIVRAKTEGQTAITMVVPDYGSGLPSVKEIFDKNPGSKSMKGMILSADRLAHFAKVRPRGQLTLRFTGANKPVIATIGERFQGAIMPIREDVRMGAVDAASNVDSEVES